MNTDRQSEEFRFRPDMSQEADSFAAVLSIKGRNCECKSIFISHSLTISYTFLTHLEDGVKLVQL